MIKDGPFIKTNNTFPKIVNNILISLIPIIVFAFYKNGIIPFVNDTTDILGLFLPLIIILCSTVTTVLTEFLYLKLIKKEKVNILNFNGRESLVQGIIIGLIISLKTPIWLVIAISFISTILAKLIFGGLGHNIFNPSVVASLIISLLLNFCFNNPSLLNSYEETYITNFEISKIGTYDILVKPAGSLWNFFFGTVPGLIGTTCSILIILSFFYLIYKKAIKWEITISYLLTIFFITFLTSIFNSNGIWFAMFQILSGSTLFAAVYLLTDFSTTPTTSVAKVLFGILAGILTVILRNVFSLNEAVFISILIVNLLSRVLDLIGAYAKFDFKKVGILFLIEFVIATGLALYLAELKIDGKTIAITENN